MRITEDNFGRLVQDPVVISDEVKQRILQNEKLREEIVDLADLWDGKESGRYGNTLERILDEIGINDVPAFYSKENMDKLIKELMENRDKRRE